MNRVLARRLMTNFWGAKILRRTCSTVVTNKVSTSGFNESNAKTNSSNDGPQHDIAIVGGGMVGIALADFIGKQAIDKALERHYY